MRRSAVDDFGANGIVKIRIGRFEAVADFAGAEMKELIRVIAKCP